MLIFHNLTTKICTLIIAYLFKEDKMCDCLSLAGRMQVNNY